MNPLVLPVRSRIRAEQLKLVHRHTPAVLVIEVAAGATLIFGLWRDVPRGRLLAWACASGLAVAVCAAYYLASRRGAPLRIREAWLVFWSVSFGLVNAACGVWLYPVGSLEHQVLVLFMLGGLGAGATTVLSPYAPALYAYVPVSLLPLAARLFLENDRVHLAAGTATVIFVLGLGWFGITINRTVSETLALRFENVELVQQLSEQRDEAERANLSKSAFLAAASHDLRQPLHTLTLFVSALDERLTRPEERRMVGNINASLRGLETLFDALLDVSRLDAGGLQPSLRHCRLSDLLARVAGDHAPEAEAKGLSLECDRSEAILHTDPALLERLLRNYVSNAVRYTERGGVRIAAVPAGSRLRIEVRDTGIGIPAEHQREIFKEFHQLGNPERDRAKGLGLGLAIVDRVARRLGHRIALESEPGRGSCFSVEVPLGDPGQVAAAEAPRAETEPRELLGLRALVVDDEHSVREGMRTLLEQWGCQVSLAASEEEALDAVRAAGLAPEVIIVDHRLREGRTGEQALERLRGEFGAEIPALVVTGDTGAERLREAGARGIHVVHKPVPPASLRAFLRSVRRPKAEP